MGHDKPDLSQRDATVTLGYKVYSVPLKNKTDTYHRWLLITSFTPVAAVVCCFFVFTLLLFGRSRKRKMAVVKRGSPQEESSEHRHVLSTALLEVTLSR